MLDTTDSSKPPVIRICDLHLSLGSQAGPVHILRGIDFEVAEGAALGIVGPSGSGKSTLLMAMAGLEPPTRGAITIAGTVLTGASEDALARFRRANMGIVFQSFHLVPTMTALENVAVPLELAGHYNALKRAAEELDTVGLSHRLDHYPGQLSGGEQQRVALARAVVARPKVLFADEPTGNLDQETGRHIIDLMFDLHDRSGTTLVLITHDQSLAQKCDIVMAMQDGKVASVMSGSGR